MRKFFGLGVLAAMIVASALVSPASAASGGGCQLQGTAAFSPPLTNTDQAFSYGFTGALSSCKSSDNGPATGALQATDWGALLLRFGQNGGCRP